MKLTWKKQSLKKNNKRPLTTISGLPFDPEEETAATGDSSEERRKAGGDNIAQTSALDAVDFNSTDTASNVYETIRLAESFQAQGDKLAEDGKYHEALGKWEAAITLMPEKATLHEQKAQVLLEIGETWKSLKAATRATELEPSWAEAWLTLGRAQLNFGEPDSAIESFDKALAIKPDAVEAREDRQTALHLLKKRKQLHLSGHSVAENRFVVGENTPEGT